MLKNDHVKHIALVSDNAEIAQSVASQLTDGTRFGTKYTVDIVNDTSEDERAKLRDQVSGGQLDGFIWLSDDAIASRNVTYGARETSDFTEDAGLQSAISSAIMKHELASRGVAASDVDSLLKEVHIKTVPIQKGKEAGSVSGLEWLSSFLLAMMLYLTLIVYGMSVMRSVLEEKTSRVMEVMLELRDAETADGRENSRCRSCRADANRYMVRDRGRFWRRGRGCVRQWSATGDLGGNARRAGSVLPRRLPAL